MAKYEILAFASLSLNIISFASLLYTVYMTRNTSSLPYIWLAGNICAQILLIIYGLANKSYGIYAPSIVLLVGILYITFVKLENSVFSAWSASGQHHDTSQPESLH